MKRNIIIVALMAAATMQAKDIKTVQLTTEPQMHCQNCEKKIKGNMRFEKGVKKIETNVERQVVTITYDADKTTVANIVDGFTKFGYKARPLEQKTQKKARP